MNPFLKRLAQKGNTGHGNRSETRVMQKLGARQQPASGAMQGAKSDGILLGANFRLEAKSTTADTMRLEMGWLKKISDEARAHGQVPGLTISFVDGDGNARQRKDAEWVCIPMSTFQEVFGGD